MRGRGHVCGIGALVVLGGLVFNWATANDGGGANIGAGLMVLAGVGVAACGMLTFLIGLIAHLSGRHR